MSNYTTETIQLINETTTEFYSSVAESFSETRQHEWEGWRQILSYFKDGNSVLDLGCGNCRFAKFLNENNIKVKVNNYDNFAWDEKVKQVDIIDSLLNDSLNLNSYDVAVCFGVMHHIPTTELREKLLSELTKSKITIVSFWQFEKDKRIFNKAQETTEAAKSRFGLQNLEVNDYFLGWKDREDVFRFCHNFTDEEMSSIKQQLNVVEDYCADGSNALNRYLVLKERCV